MTSRERLLCTINHKEPDRVVLDLGGCQVSGIQATLYNKLKNILGIDNGDIYVYEPLKQLSLVEEEVRSVLGIDTLTVVPDHFDGWAPGYLTDGTPAKFPNSFNFETLEDGTKVIRETNGYFGTNEKKEITNSMPSDADYFYRIFHPLKEAETLDDIESFQYYPGQDPEVVEKWQKRLEEESRRNKYGVVLDTLWGGFGFLLEVLVSLRGMEELLIDMMINHELVNSMMDKRLNAMLERWSIVLEGLNGNADVVCIADDLGTQKSLLISPETYRTILKPFHKKLIEFIKSKSNAKVFMHSCGAISELIPDLIDVGVDILNPVQTTAEGMDPKKLKDEFGKDIVFWGGIDSQDVLQHGTPDQVREEVRRKIDIFAPGGGFVFNTCHNLQGTAPIENVEALFKEFSKYA